MESIKNTAPAWAKRISAITITAVMAYVPALSEKGYSVSISNNLYHGGRINDTIGVSIYVQTVGVEENDPRYYINNWSVSNVLNDTEEVFERACSSILHEIASEVESLPTIE